MWAIVGLIHPPEHFDYKPKVYVHEQEAANAKQLCRLRELKAPKESVGVRRIRRSCFHSASLQHSSARRARAGAYQPQANPTKQQRG